MKINLKFASGPQKNFKEVDSGVVAPLISHFVNHAVARGLGTTKQPVRYELLALIVFMNGWLRFLFVGIHLDLLSESVRIFHDKTYECLAVFCVEMMETSR
jgi:hypothetical protein